jgi:hypothetical protein
MPAMDVFSLNQSITFLPARPSQLATSAPELRGLRYLGALRHRPDPETCINFSITWRPSACASRGLTNDSMEDWTSLPLSRMSQR